MRYGCRMMSQDGQTMYTFDSRIRFSEVDVNKKLSTVGLIDYFQDCSTFQSEDLGVGFDFMTANHAAWIVNYWEIEFYRMPSIGERVRIGTLPYAMKGFMGLRNFWMETAAGERLAAANSVWTLLDMEKQYPMRVPPLLHEKYVLSPRLEMKYSQRKVKIPQTEAVQGERIHVMPFHLDTNGHMNNAQYVRLVTDCLPVGRGIERLRIEYKKQAKLGDSITPLIYRAGDDDITAALMGEDNEAYAAAQVLLRAV